MELIPRKIWKKFVSYFQRKLNIVSNIKVLFVCLGNICRSPTAEAAFTSLVEGDGLSKRIEIDSAGTAAWHVGKAPDHRAIAAGKKRSFDLSHLRARQAKAKDFSEFDYILAMDAENLSDLRSIQPSDSKAKLCLFLDYAASFNESEVPDPYYGGKEGFEHVLDLVEDASQGLLAEIKNRL